MSACTVPCCSAVISSGSASNPTTFTLPDLPAWRIPVAAPSAENRLVAKMATMPGSFCSSASVTCAARDAVSWSYCTPTYEYFGLALAAAAKPAVRSSVVLMPGFVLTTNTWPPLGASCSTAAKASAPPAVLSDEICETAPAGSVRVVSTRTTLMPAAIAWEIGGRVGDLSPGGSVVEGGGD